MKIKLRIGVLGVGHIAENFHIPAINRNKNIELVAICDVNKKRISKIRKKFKVKKTYFKFNKMLLKENLDAVLISTPPKSHKKDILDAVKNKVNILVEKPFVKNLKDFKDLKKNFSSYKQYVQCALHQRYRPISIAAKSIIEKKILGELYFINIIHRSFRGIPKHSEVFSKKILSGGGPLIDLGSHYFDLLSWILNFPKINNSDCTIFKEIFKNNNSKKHLPFNYFDNEEMAVGNMKLKNKILVNFELGYANNLSNEKIKIEFFGTKGSYTWPNENYQILRKNKLFKKRFNLEKGLASDKQIGAFCKNIILKKNSNRNLKQYEYIVKLIDNLYEKSQKN